MDLTVSGLEKVWLATSELEIPFTQIKRAAVVSLDALKMPPIKRFGKRLSRRNASGRFSGGDENSGTELWAVHGGDEVLVLDLTGASFSRIVLQVDDPEAWAAKLSAALTTEESQSE